MNVISSFKSNNKTPCSSLTKAPSPVLQSSFSIPLPFGIKHGLLPHGDDDHIYFLPADLFRDRRDLQKPGHVEIRPGSKHDSKACSLVRLSDSSDAPWAAITVSTDASYFKDNSIIA